MDKNLKALTNAATLPSQQPQYIPQPSIWV